MTTLQLPSRRDRNKSRTQQAIVEAVYALLAEEQAHHITAERVADRAGISRRTFFNYFTSVEAVIAFRVGLLQSRWYAALAARSLDESLIESANAVVAEAFSVADLADAAVAWRACEESPGALRLILEATQESAAELTRSWAAERLHDRRLSTGTPGGDEPRVDVAEGLRLQVLTGAMLTAFDLAQRHWIRRHTGPVDDEAREQFLADVHAAFDALRPAVDALEAHALGD